jgi:chromosome partitioning protein
MRILGVVNQKGGCGKTTTAINLAACLARQERRVLLVDMDPQGHATAALNATHLPVQRDLRSALLNFYDEPVPLSQMTVSPAPDLYLIPSLLSLVALEQELSNAANREKRLKGLLERGGAEQYDYVIIDSPPNLGILTVNTLTASRELVVPVDTGMFALHGLRRLFHVVDLIQERTGTVLEPHILLTLYDQRVRLARTILAELEAHFSGQVLKAKIRSNIHLKEAASYGLPIIRHMPNSIGAWDYQELAQEILSQEVAPVVSAESTEEAEATGAAIEPQPEVDRGEGLTSEVIFSMSAPAAREVHVSGEFNNWQLGELTALERDECGVWKRRLQLTPGNYQYKYYVDGQWVVDPENPLRIVNEDGQVNSLLKVK